MTRAESDPDPVWRLGPLAPDPGPALTAEEAAEFAAYDNHLHSMQMGGIDGRAESDPNWAVPTRLTTRLPWEADRQAENEPEAEVEP
jgi:hypothetical protein